MKCAFTGGGTLGHVIPALAVWYELRKDAVEGFYIGSKKEEERALVEASGLVFHPISTGKLRRHFSLKNLTDVFRVIGGIFSSYSILRRERPDVLFSKGGYVSVPPVIAASRLHIPVVIHESDLTMGLANRISSRYAARICHGFDTGPWADGRHVWTGSPVRREILEAADDESLTEERDLVLVLGGSQGSDEVNQLVWSSLDQLLPRFHIIHQTGAKAHVDVEREGYEAYPFIDAATLGGLMKRARVVVSRAGANSLSELCLLGKAMVLVPLRSATRGDQVENAAWLKERGAALVLEEGGSLVDLVTSVLCDDLIHDRLCLASASLGRRDGAQAVAGQIKGCVNV